MSEDCARRMSPITPESLLGRTARRKNKRRNAQKSKESQPTAGESAAEVLPQESGEDSDFPTDDEQWWTEACRRPLPRSKLQACAEEFQPGRDQHGVADNDIPTCAQRWLHGDVSVSC